MSGPVDYHIVCFKCGHPRISDEYCSNQLCHGPRAPMIENPALAALKSEISDLKAEIKILKRDVLFLEKEVYNERT